MSANTERVETFIAAWSRRDMGGVMDLLSDRFHVDGTGVELPGMGSFEIAEGRITAGRDDFDLAQLQRQMPGSG